MDATFNVLNTYSLSEIIFLLVVAASSLMAAGRFFEWATSNLRKVFSKEHTVKAKEDALEIRLKNIEDKQLKEEAAIEGVIQSLDFFSDKLEILVESDKDSIKAYLTDKRHYYVHTQKWIDDYNLDCIERRYVHYKKSGGNSFVDHLMEELRALPTQPPGPDS